MINPLIGMPQGAEWIVILAIVILVFGAAKLPDLARGTGQALRIFKNETKGLRDDDDATKPTPEPTPASEISAAGNQAPAQTVQAPAQTVQTPVQTPAQPVVPVDEARVVPEADVRRPDNG